MSLTCMNQEEVVDENPHRKNEPFLLLSASSEKWKPSTASRPGTTGQTLHASETSTINLKGILYAAYNPRIFPASRILNVDSHWCFYLASLYNFISKGLATAIQFEPSMNQMKITRLCIISIQKTTNMSQKNRLSKIWANFCLDWTDSLKESCLIHILYFVFILSHNHPLSWPWVKDLLRCILSAE